MYSAGIVAQFEAAHHLSGDFGPAVRPHGHTYRVEVTVSGERLRPDGTVCDIGELQTLVHDALAPLHYRDLNQLDAFRGRNSTAEAVAEHLFSVIAPPLADRDLAGLSVRVWESPGAFGAYEGTL